MHLLDTRRLTGPSHLSRSPLVIVEIALELTDVLDHVCAAYRDELGRMRQSLGLEPRPDLVRRTHVGGVVIGYEAPIDVMLACAEMSEWAVLSATEMVAQREPLPLEPKRVEIAAMLEAQASPRLLALREEAARRSVPFVWDDEELTLGAGRRSATFPMPPRGVLPTISEVPWQDVGRIPIALVTGTNGKTTSSRLLARVASEAGLVVGAASTGGVTIGGEIVEDGDWTGPAAARVVLRRKDVELAVLETARGGILRRGLAVDECDVALVTNVSDDHLGLFGIDDVPAMAEVKGVVARAVRAGGTAALSAHDPHLVAMARRLRCHVTMFATLEGRRHGEDPAFAVLAEAREKGHRSVFTHDGAIVIAEGKETTTLMRIDEVPITFGGAADYNVQNVLGVVAAAVALGIPRDAIVRGLGAFDMKDNPGRGQLYTVGGVRVLVDFGHNPEGVRAVMQLVARLRERGSSGRGRLIVVTGSPGDRPDREIEEIARVIQEARPDRVLVRELADYLRGRQAGDVPAVFRRAFLSAGLPESAFGMADSEIDALERSLESAMPGDVVVVLVHLDEAAVKEFLDARGAT